jgi:hypothetical protein
MIRGDIMFILIGGIINAVVATILQIMAYPGAFVWGALVFSIEFIPCIGSFMCFMHRLYTVNFKVAVMASRGFYLAIDELMADFTCQKVRSNNYRKYNLLIPLQWQWALLVLLIITGYTTHRYYKSILRSFAINLKIDKLDGFKDSDG